MTKENQVLNEEEIKRRFLIYADNIKTFIGKINKLKSTLDKKTYKALKQAHTKYYEHVLKLANLDLKNSSLDDVNAFYFLGKELDILFDNYKAQMIDFGLEPISYK